MIFRWRPSSDKDWVFHCSLPTFPLHDLQCISKTFVYLQYWTKSTCACNVACNACDVIVSSEYILWIRRCFRQQRRTSRCIHRFVRPVPTLLVAFTHTSPVTGWAYESQVAAPVLRARTTLEIIAVNVFHDCGVFLLYESSFHSYVQTSSAQFFVVCRHFSEVVKSFSVILDFQTNSNKSPLSMNSFLFAALSRKGLIIFLGILFYNIWYTYLLPA